VKSPRALARTFNWRGATGAIAARIRRRASRPPRNCKGGLPSAARWALVDFCLAKYDEALRNRSGRHARKTAHVYTQIAMVHAKPRMSRFFRPWSWLDLDPI
jgi:hypothetical protein